MLHVLESGGYHCDTLFPPFFLNRSMMELFYLILLPSILPQLKIKTTKKIKLSVSDLPLAKYDYESFIFENCPSQTYLLHKLKCNFIVLNF